MIDLARQTGLAIGGDASLLEGKQAPALSGNYTPAQALRALLAGSGVIAVRVENGYRLEAAPQETSESNTLDAVSVYGRQKNDTVEAIPQSVSVYGRENFELAQANAVGDIVRGASLVVWAIRDGRDSAQAILEYLDTEASAIAAE